MSGLRRPNRNIMRSRIDLTATNGVARFARQASLGISNRLFSLDDQPMADLRFHCVICGMRLEITSDFAGGVMECPSCLRVVPVPTLLTRPHENAGCVDALPPGILSIEIKILCGTCDTKIRLDARMEGQTVTCPICLAEIRVPEWSRAPGAAARPAVTTLSAAEIEFLSASVA